MALLSAKKFLAWAQAKGIAPDARYEEPRCLAYTSHEGDSRFWVVPEGRGEQPRFIEHLLLGLDPWSACYLWPRGGRWPNREMPHSRLDEVRHTVHFGSQVPDGFEGAVMFERQEFQQLSNVVLRHIQVGWCVDDDLFAVPDHGQELLQTDHHGVVHVTSTAESRLQALVLRMTNGGYLLPTQLSDATFNRPDWM